MTGIKGLVDLRLDVNFAQLRETFGGDAAAMKSAASDLITSALEEQLGLKLERRRVPLQRLIVENGDKVPAEN